MSPEDVLANVTAAERQMEAIDNALLAERAYKSARSDCKAGTKEHIALIRRAIKCGKTSSNYSTGMGRTLDAIGTGDTIVADEYVPNGNLRAMSNKVLVRFKKKGGNAKAIYCHVLDEDAETFFKKIGIASHSPFEDTTPLLHPLRPEKRQYQLRGIINDKEIGHFSNTMEVVAVG